MRYKLDHSLPARDDVDEGKLHEGEEDETGADKEPDVNELDVGHLRQICSAGAGKSIKLKLGKLQKPLSVSDENKPCG